MEAPAGHVEDIPTLVNKLLDQNDLALRPDTKRRNLGEDIDGSFKVMLQIANVANSILTLNTCLLALAECKDSPDNIESSSHSRNSCQDYTA